MAQSTEDYLDSLLRQAMGIPDPEPEVKPEPPMPDLARDDVLAMAEGLTGSNSAILGNVYDHNASFTNEGEIEIPAPEIKPAAEEPQIPEEAHISPENMPDPDAPPVISKAEEDIPPIDTTTLSVEENILPAIEPEPEPEPVIEPEIIAEPVEIPQAPVIEPSDSLDLMPESVMEGLVEPSIEASVYEAPVIEEPIIEEPIIEEPVIEAPVIEEPVIEEPVIEEPVIAEEPIIAEPVIEESSAPSISIDDLDPNDSSKALDPDMIAALFESANADAPEAAPAEDASAEESVAEEPVIEDPAIEEPAIEKPAIEEPVIEEPVIAEEPIIEEPVIEEPIIEEPAIEEPIIEEPAIEEPVAEESAAEEPAAEEPEIAEPEMEELSIPEKEGDSPLMPDQEISDLLSTLGEITGEGVPEEEAEEAIEESIEESVEEASDEASEEASEEPAEPASPEEPSLDGIDMFDTDLSAMLDDVTNSLEAEPKSGEEAADTDLSDLIGALDDGSGDLSDIGDLLEKDENSELVDPNTETAEALFASDSEENLFDIENVIDEEEGKGKKKKKKRGLFGRKKKSDNVETIGGEEEMLVDPDLLDIPDEKDIKKKKPGFFATLFAKLFEEVGEDGDQESELIGLEQTAVEIAQEGAEENEAILAELSEEEGKDKKKGKKEKKKKEKKDKKKDKKGQDAEGEEGEEGAAETKKKKKKEKKKKEEVPELPSKRLPRKKVVAISLFCITIGIVITFLAFMYPYSQDMKKAKKFYTTGEYQKTYEYMRGHRLTSEDQILYNKTTTLLRIKRPYDSYQNYMKMGLRMEALNALVQGVQMADKYAEEAASLGITDKYSQLSRKIYDELYNSFGVTIERARSWIELEGSPEYTKALYECLISTSAARPSQDNVPAPEITEEVDPVIDAEENDL